MAEYIEKGKLFETFALLEDDAMQKVLEYEWPSSEYMCSMAVLNERTAAKQLVFDTPAADVVPVVHGHWVTTTMAEENIWGHVKYKCSACGGESWFHPDYISEEKYCRECGARMDG